MKVGKTILGLPAVSIISKTHPNPVDFINHIVSLSMEEIESTKSKLGKDAGVTYRGMYVEDLPVSDQGNKSGYMLDLKYGPLVPVDDESQYHYKHYFVELNAEGKYVQLYEINNYSSALEP